MTSTIVTTVAQAVLSNHTGRGCQPQTVAGRSRIGGADAVPDAFLEAGSRLTRHGPPAEHSVKTLELVVFGSAVRAAFEMRGKTARAAQRKLAGAECAQVTLDTFAVHGHAIQRATP